LFLFFQIRIFVGFQWVLISLQFLLSIVITDTPEDVEIQLRRAMFFQDKVIEKVADEDFFETAPEETQKEADEEGDDDKEDKPDQCCGMRPGHNKQTRVRNLPNEYPLLKYPTETSKSAWPNPLLASADPNISEKKAPVKNESPKSQFVNYATSHAVGTGSATNSDKDSMVRNPAFPEHKTNNQP
jgi:hypothetical protein